MCTNWKGFTLRTIILASLSLFLFGCGSGSTPEAPALKEVRGIVSDKTTGKAYANATVTAYAIDASGNVAGTPLSVPAAVQSDSEGNFVLEIPETYAGGILFQATEAGSTVLRAVLPSVTQNDNETVSISLATEMVVQYIEKNKTGSFTSVNIRKAILVLEHFFGLNFMQVTAPAIGSAPTQAQQQVIVMTQAIELLLTTGGYTIADLVTIDANSGLIAMGEGAAITALTGSVVAVTNNLISQGTVSGSFTFPTITPVPEPDLSDTTAPTAPQNITATSTANSVTLSWGAATDAVGVTAYYIYRDGVFIGSVASSLHTYNDSLVDSGTSYSYDVRARDAAGNLSITSHVDILTARIQTYTISGRVTSGTSGLASVYVTIAGSGTGVFVTDANGNYAVTGVIAGSYTITPVFSGYAFTPAGRTVGVTTANVTGVDFAAEVVNTGTVVGGTIYPPGTIIGGISYPSGTVIGGVTYPTATVIGGVTYPTGTVTGGITYPDGVVIGGISYPSGTVIGGLAFPLGTVTAGFIIPSGTVIGGVTYPAGTVVGGVIYPSGTVIGSVTYPSGTVVGGVTYPSGVINGTVSYPAGTIIGGISYPSGTVIGGVTYPTATVIGGITYPTGTVIGGITFPDGVVIGGVSYPSGTVVGGLAFPLGTVTAGIIVPSGTVIGGVTYPSGTVAGGVIYPSGTVISAVTNPSGTVVGGVTYPSGVVNVTVSYPSGSITSHIYYPP